MEGEVQDVNTSTESSPVETTQATVEASANSIPSAETLNTEAEGKIPETVPYSRFKEVNDQLKQVREKEQALKIYEEFDAYLNKNPDKLEALQKVFAENQAAAEEGQNVDPVQTLAKQVFEMQAASTLSEYRNTFNELSKEEPQYMKDLLQQHTEAELFKLTNGRNPLEFKNPNLVRQAYQKAKQMLDGFRQAERQAYFSEKKTGNVPTQKTGSAPAVTPKTNFKDYRERASYLMEKMKASTKI